LTLGVDSFYEQAQHLIDEGQFGAPIILTPFNYRYGLIGGVEFTASYTNNNFAAYLNSAWQAAHGKGVESAQFNFDQAALNYIASNYIHLDHEGRVSASTGVSYLWFGTRVSVDALLGTGLRDDLTLPDGGVIPNGDHTPSYTQVNLGLSHAFDIGGSGPLTVEESPGNFEPVEPLMCREIAPNGAVSGRARRTLLRAASANGSSRAELLAGREERRCDCEKQSAGGDQQPQRVGATAGGCRGVGKCDRAGGVPGGFMIGRGWAHERFSCSFPASNCARLQNDSGEDRLPVDCANHRARSSRNVRRINTRIGRARGHCQCDALLNVAWLAVPRAEDHLKDKFMR
jgi:hypothetical protein